MSQTTDSESTGGEPQATAAKRQSKADPARRGEWAIGVLRLLGFLSLVGGLILGVVIIAGAQNCAQAFLGSATCDSTTVTILGIAIIVEGFSGSRSTRRRQLASNTSSISARSSNRSSKPARPLARALGHGGAASATPISAPPPARAARLTMAAMLAITTRPPTISSARRCSSSSTAAPTTAMIG